MAITPLTLYLTDVAATTISTPAQLVHVASGSPTVAEKDTKLGTATGYGELFGLGTASPWPARTSIGTPSGNGWLFDATTLEGTKIDAGVFTVKCDLGTDNVSAITASVTGRVYVRHSDGSYTLLGKSTLTGMSLTSSGTSASFTIPVNAVRLLGGDKLYLDLWANITANSVGNSALKLAVFHLSTDTSTGDVRSELVTPGYEPFSGVVFMHAGQDITDAVDELSMDIKDTFGQGAGAGAGSSGRASTVEFRTTLGPCGTRIGAGQPLPSGKQSLVDQGETVVFNAAGTKVFAGYGTLFEDATTGKLIRTKVTCSDYWADAARIIVNEVYTGQTDQYIILDLVSKYAPWLDTTHVLTSGFVVPKIYMQGISLQKALQSVADKSGWEIWIDFEKALWYINPGGEGTASFSVSESPDGVSSYGLRITKFSQDNTAIINRVTFKGGKKSTDDFTQDLSNQADGSNDTFILAYYPHEAADGKVHIKVNGVDLNVGFALHNGAANVLVSDGGTADCLVNADAETVQFDPTKIPAATDTVQAVYRYQVPLYLVVTAPDSFAYYGQWYDGTLTDTSVFDVTTALQRCRVLLAEQKFGLLTFEFVTQQGGLQSGQLVSVAAASHGINGTYLIQQVETKSHGAGQLEYTVDVGAWSWNLVDMMVLAAQNNTLQDTSDNEATTVIQAEEESESLSISDSITVVSETTTGEYYCGNCYSGFATILQD